MEEISLNAKTEMMLKGITSPLEIIRVSDELINFQTQLDETLDEASIQLYCIKKRYALLEAKLFLNSLFKLHEVNWIGDKDFEELKSLPCDNLEGLVDEINKRTIMVHPYKIPVKFTSKGDYFNGSVVETGLLIDDEEIIKRIKMFFVKIHLASKCTNVTSGCYIHEIVHTQIDSQKGVIKDFNNEELLNIFLEFIYAFYTEDQHYDHLGLAIKWRLSYLRSNINSLKNHYNGEKVLDNYVLEELSRYTNSTIRALKLFQVYKSGDKVRRLYILDTIQDIFDGKRDLEGLLEEFGITTNDAIKDEEFVMYLKKGIY